MPGDYQNMAEKSNQGTLEAINYETDFENKNYDKGSWSIYQLAIRSLGISIMSCI